MEATGIILAGGKSSRMGTNKALLKMEGKAVIERIVEELQKVVDSMMIVTNSFEEYAYLNLPMVKDEWKGMGPLAGIHAGLTASQTEKNLVVACDMPFISPKLGTLLLSQLGEDFQVVIPEISGQLHPLFAAYRKEVKEEAQKALESDQRRIRSIFNHLKVKIMTESDLKDIGFLFQDRDFYNMNYPNEYEEAKYMIKQQKAENK
jgi:molybdopterin-guanine dinucleotide biosynthesis protein A